MSKHTPGPWSFHPDCFNTENTGSQLGSICDRDGWYLAAVEGDVEGYVANARLIAKAPEMLELLRQLVDGYPIYTLTNDARSLLEELDNG